MTDPSMATPEDIEEFIKLSDKILEITHNKKARVVLSVLCSILTRSCIEMRVKKAHLLSYVSDTWEKEEERMK